MSLSLEISIRDSQPCDMGFVQEIYAHEVRNGCATFEEVPPTVDELLSRRDSVLVLDLPYLVAEMDGNVVGYSYATTYRPRSAYRYTVESSVYVAVGHQRKGIGRALLSELIARCEQGVCRQMIAVIGDSANTGSIVLHKSLGFSLVGTLFGAGFKHGAWVDTVLMQRVLNEGSESLPKDIRI